jgi:hypothetical protein
MKKSQRKIWKGKDYYVHFGGGLPTLYFKIEKEESCYGMV